MSCIHSDPASVIRKARQSLRLRQEDLGRLLGVTANCISNWEAGRSRPDLSQVPALCRALSVTPDELFGFPVLSPEEHRLLTLFRSLDSASAEYAVRMVSGLRDLHGQRIRRPDLRPVPAGGLWAAAGTGTPLEDAQWETVLLRRCELTDSADEIITVNGDSMEPVFSDGDRVLVCHRETPRPGQIGIFTVDGQGYIKEYRQDRLVSLNPLYPDIILNDSSDVRCYGRVLGRIGPDMIPSAEEIRQYRLAVEE